jgi:hypothetical protein
MKSILLIVLNIVFLLLLITAPALKKINRARLFTTVMLLLYSIGMIKLVSLFPVLCLSLLGLGILAVLSIAFLSRQKSIRRAMKGADHKMQFSNWRQHDICINNSATDIKKQWKIS